jgi:hypothetical protein
LPSPARLRHAWDASLGGKVSEADPAHAEFAKESARAPAEATPVMEPDLVLGVHEVSLPALKRCFFGQAFSTSS